MNRENKRKTFEKGYYKTHRCNDTFSCRVCDRLVFPTPTGGDHRNHCPNCLWAVIHRCRRCGKLSSNRVAGDDNPMKLMSIALKPLSLPPFPLERIEQLTDAMGGSGSLGIGGRTP